VDFILNRDPTDFILVGHSYGGTIIANVAEAVPDRVRRLVFWSGMVLNDRHTAR
jgi:pimeloyl-ACP methyl ester carboxylesterase